MFIKIIAIMGSSNLYLPNYIIKKLKEFNYFRAAKSVCIICNSLKNVVFKKGVEIQNSDLCKTVLNSEQEL